jgi:hypothetical protein
MATTPVRSRTTAQTPSQRWNCDDTSSRPQKNLSQGKTEMTSVEVEILSTNSDEGQANAANDGAHDRRQRRLNRSPCSRSGTRGELFACTR